MQEQKLKFYYFPLSPPARTVHFLLSDGNIPFETVTLDLFKGEHKTAEFSELNPNQTVPVLVDGDVVLWESQAICKYLVDKYPGVPDHWYPRNDRATRAKVDQWCDWINTIFRPTFLAVLRPPIFNERHHPDESVHNFFVDTNKEKMSAALDLVDKHLAKTGSQFIVGNEVTIADLALHLQVGLLTLVVDENEMLQPAKRPHLKAWYDRVPEKTPHWKEINATFLAAQEAGRKKKEEEQKIKFYYFPLSPPARTVHFLLSDGNIPFNTITLDLFKGEHKTAEFSELNPNQTVPVLVDGETVLWESQAISKYLVDKFPSVPDHWYPRNDRAARAKVDQWCDWTNTIFRPTFLAVLRPPIFNERHHPDENVHNFFVDSNKEKMSAALDLVDKHLAKTGNEFIVGNEMTIADLALHLQVGLLTLVVDENEMLQPAKRTHLKAWYDRVPEKTPHWKEINATFLAAQEAGRKKKEESA